MSSSRPENVVYRGLSAEELRELGLETTEAIVEIFTGLRKRIVGPSRARRVEWDPSLPATGSAPLEIIRKIRGALAPQASLFHPRLFGFISSSNLEIASFVDALASAINANLAGPDGGPAAVELEQLVIRWLAELADFPATSGVLTSGASMANLMALAAALRHSSGPRLRRVGLQVLAPASRFMVYATKSVHSSVRRAADLLGLGTENVVFVGTDSLGRMDPDELGRQVQSDRAAGRIPFCVVATAGTSNTGVVDPLDGIAGLCASEQLWLHVDGAYGAFARLTALGNKLLAGLDHADSLALDPHKWLGVPYDAGCLLFRDPDALRMTFGSGRHTGEVSFLELGLEESRRFRGLKIWACMQFLGRDGYRRLLEHNLRLARKLQAWVDESPDLELISPAELTTVVFRYAPNNASGHIESTGSLDDFLNRLNLQLSEWVTSTGQTWAQTTSIRGKVGIRVCLTNFRTDEKDIRWFLNLVRSMGAGVLSSANQESSPESA